MCVCVCVRVCVCMCVRKGIVYVDCMNDIIYIPPMKLEGQAQKCVIRRSLMFYSYGADSQVRMSAVIPLLVE